MQNLSNTQYFKIGKDKKVGVDEVLSVVYSALAGEGIQSGKSDCGVYYVRRPYVYYQPQKCKKPDYEGGEGRIGGGTSERVHFC